MLTQATVKACRFNNDGQLRRLHGETLIINVISPRKTTANMSSLFQRLLFLALSSEMPVLKAL